MNRIKTYILIIGLVLSYASCRQDNASGYTIKGNVKECGQWGDCGQLVLAKRDNGKQTFDTVNIINGNFTLTGHITTPDFASLVPVQSDKDKPKGRILFFLENEKYSIKIRNGILSRESLKGGTSEKLFKELSGRLSKLDEIYSIESIDRQLNTTHTPAYRMEKLRIVRHEYDSVVKTFKDSIIRANTPSYFSLYMTSVDIANGENPDSILQALEVYLKNERFKDDPRLRNMIGILEEEKRRP